MQRLPIASPVPAMSRTRANPEACFYTRAKAYTCIYTHAYTCTCPCPRSHAFVRGHMQ